MTKTIIFSPTEKCNANCIYCEVIKRKKPVSMSESLLKTFFQRINVYLESAKNEKIQVIWYGGEVLMLGAAYFENAFGILKSICSKTLNRIEHIIQSNITLLDQRFIDIFRENGVRSLSTSVDFIPGNRGIGPEIDTMKYNKLFFRGLNVIRKNNFEWDFVYVITKKAVHQPREIMQYLLNLKPDGKFVFHPVLLYGMRKKDLVPTNKELSDFLGKAFEYWYAVRDQYPAVEPFAGMLKHALHGTTPSFCNLSGDCGNSWCFIGPSGEVSQCGKSSLWEVIDYGNISAISLSEVFNHIKRKVFYERQDHLKNGVCKDCRFWNMCHGGCPMESFIKHGTIDNKTCFCEAYKKFFTRYFEPITNIKITCNFSGIV